jgi:peptidoglycan hydrolase CwlO-like protein
MKKISKNLKRRIAGILLVPTFLAFQFSFFGTANFAKADDVAVQGPDTAAISDTQSSISDLQKKIDKQKKEAEALTQNLGQIKNAVVSTQKEIAKTQSSISEADQNIARKNEEIIELNEKMFAQKEILKSFIQQMYYAKNEPVLNMVLSGKDLAQVFSRVDHYSTLEDKIMAVSEEINISKNQIEQNKLEVVAIKEKSENILDQKIDIKQDLVADQIGVQVDLADKQKVIDKLNKELNELQGDLSKLTGKSYDAKDIKDAVSFASDKTGVPKGFLIGVLKMETNLGANVGGCTYGEVESGAQASYKAGKLGKTAWATFLKRRDTFKSICKEIGIDYTKQKVSCNPKGYTGTGGAMGVAQFMPDTWVAYKSQVASSTGHNPPSPWNLTDGVMAMALKLGRVPGVTAGKTSAYKTAACAYLGTCYAPYINGILYWADNYKDLIN